MNSSKVNELFVSADGRKLYIVCAAEPKILIVDLITQVEISKY